MISNASIRIASRLFGAAPSRRLPTVSSIGGYNCARNPQRYASSTTTTRLFTEKHEWITVDEKQIGRVGISNHAQEALGDVVYVQVPEVGSKCNQYDEVGAIESVKAASELVTPVSGEITSINATLEKEPALINTDCYNRGWLFEIKLDQPKELEKLMDEQKYEEFLKEESSDSQ